MRACIDRDVTVRRPPMRDPQRKPSYGGPHQLSEQMSNMDLNGQRGAPPSSRSSSDIPGHQGGGYGRPPIQEYHSFDPNQDGQGGYDNYAGYDDGYGQRPHNGPGSDFGPPARSMTTPMNDYNSDRSMPPPPRRVGTMPFNDPAGQGLPERPSTTTGNRIPPQRSFTADPRRPHPNNHAGGYDDSQGYQHQQRPSFDQGYGGAGYYSNARGNTHDYQPHPNRQSQASLPDFDNIPQNSSRNSFEETLRPGFEQAQRGAHQTAQLSHAQSQPNLRQAQTAVFEMAGDIPSVPPMPQIPPQNQRPGSGPTREAILRKPAPKPVPIRGPDISRLDDPDALPAHPTPESSKSTDSLPAHPAPVRPGLMANSMVNLHEKPPPVRNYGVVPQGGPMRPQNYQNPQLQQQRQGAVQQQPQQQAVKVVAKPREPPVTPQELEHLRMVIKKTPGDQQSALRLAKRLVEAADVLLPNVPDPKVRGKARERYLMDAHKLLKKLSNTQNPEAMFVMADALGRGMFGGGDADAKEAFTLYQSAAKLGHAAAAYRTAVCCEIGHDEGGGTRKDPLKAIQWYKRAATLGDPPAMYKVGMILLKGLLGQTRNPREAVGWLKRAAERADPDNPHALHELGLLYESAQPNDAIIRDEHYAFTLFLQGAELGYKFSQFRMACAYEYGLLGCPIDPRMSIMWYSKAAQQEEHQSELALSGWYLTGSDGVLGQSDTEAYLWARKAAIAGLAKAEYAMGYFTEVGIGVAANMEDAKRWYWRAAGKFLRLSFVYTFVSLLTSISAQDFPQARERLEELKRTGGKGPSAARQRERISRSRIEKQQDGDCVVM